MYERGLIVNLFTQTGVQGYKRPLTFPGGGHAFGDAREVTVVATLDEGRNGTMRELPEDSRIFEPSDKAPAAVLVIRNVGGDRVVCLAPLDYAKRWYMSAGALADSSDGRWRRLVGFYGGVMVHDRYETGER